MPRKVAFSGKQKKKQLQEKKKQQQSKAGGRRTYLNSLSDDEDETSRETPMPSFSPNPTPSDLLEEGLVRPEEAPALPTGMSYIESQLGKLEVQKINQQPKKNHLANIDINEFRLHFFKETDEAIKRKRREARKPIRCMDEARRDSCLLSRLQDVYPAQVNLDFPKRPPWDYSLTKQQLDTQEKAYFESYVQSIISQPRRGELGYFELNLETWRQLWRVMEISDILVVIADIRHPLLHLPPSLIQYIQKDLKKSVVIILNKADFVPAPLALAWRRYLQAQFPGVGVVLFTSYPRQIQQDGTMGGQEFDPSHRLYKRPFQGKFTPVGPTALYHHCKDLAPSTGYPNVGKSSLINALLNRKAVSVSKNPGHTKHLQTHFLCPSVKLCDCPGLVFPSIVSKSLQVLAGIFPVSQVREPFSNVGYLAKRVDLPPLLGLAVPSHSPRKKNKEFEWSALDICEAFASKSGFFTAKAGRPDGSRGANKILRMAVEGQICLCFHPPQYTETYSKLLDDPETKAIQKMLVQHPRPASPLSDLEAEDSESASVELDESSTECSVELEDQDVEEDLTTSSAQGCVDGSGVQDSVESQSFSGQRFSEL